MTPERARYILATRTKYGALRDAFKWREDSTEQTYPDGITREEDSAIRELWRTMPGHTCYMDAIHRIARGQAKPRGWALEATATEWNAAYGDYDEIDLDHYSREATREAAEDDAREVWAEHGYNPSAIVSHEIW